MGGLGLILRGLGPTKLASMIGVAAALIGFFIFVSTRVAAPNMALLYSGLELEDSGAIVSQLETMKIPYDLRNNGSEILVPSTDALRLRVTLAREGLPSGGNVGYEIFDKSQSLGTTSFQQDINRLRALEGEIARTIRTIDKVMGARVHLVLAKREVFERDKRDPTASIILKMKGAARLDSQQVQAIQHLVAAAVPGLKPNAISIIDGRGTLLARGMTGEDGERAPSNLEEMRIKLESRLEHSVEELLQRSIGIGNVRAEVSAEIDFDRTTVNSESFNPDGQVVRSTQTVEEQAKASETDASKPVSIASNLPPNQSDTTGKGSNSANSRTEETVNYEISKTTKTQIHEAGLIRRLSIAVLVNGKTTPGQDGKTTFEPRTPEELAQLTALVKSAIGYDEKRGDKVDVVSMQFATVDEIEAQAAEPAFLGLTKNDYFRITEMLVLTVIGILVLLLVIRPLVSRGLGIAADAMAHSTQRALAMAGTAALPGPDGHGGELAGRRGVENLQPSELEESLIDIERIEGQVKASSLKKIGELVERHPDETVSIMRSWLYQDA